MRGLLKVTILCLFLGFSGIIAMFIINGKTMVTTSDYIRNIFALGFFSAGICLVVFLMSMVGFFTRVIRKCGSHDKWWYILSAFIALLLCFLTSGLLARAQWRGATRCYSNLSQIGMVLYQYQNKHGSLPIQGNKFDLYDEEISGDLSSIRVCPMSILTKFWKRGISLGYGETTYKMAEKIELEQTYYAFPPHTPTDKIIMWCPYHGKIGVPVLLANGNVQNLKLSELRFEHGKVTLK